MEMYTIKQIADLAGISRRTLHYYDEKGLLEPASVGENGYRFYDRESLLRLQQILLYKEMGLALQQIKQILQDPQFDTAAALQIHRQSLLEKIEHLGVLVQTVDNTLMHMMGEVGMNDKNFFSGFSKGKQKQYEREAVERWGDTAERSIKLWNSYSEERQAEIKQEGSQIYQSIAEKMDKGPGSPEVQALLRRWQEHLRNFYEPTLDTLEGLGNMYYEHPDFKATFTAVHPELPRFLKEAVAIYASGLRSE